MAAQQRLPMLIMTLTSFEWTLAVLVGMCIEALRKSVTPPGLQG